MNVRLEQTESSQIFQRSTATGRWATLGPYYAMFPVSFVVNTIETFSPSGGRVLDPFCGRGTVPFVSKATGHESVGIDINPVAYVFSAAKTDPEPDPKKLIVRIEEIAASVLLEDLEAENEFQQWAWCSQALGFLRAARRLLKWSDDRCDRTLMAIILVYLHGKLGNAISNQMRQSKGMAPNYSVKWWKDKGMEPPLIDPKSYFISRVEWRYRKGIVEGPHSEIILGDSASELSELNDREFQFLLTSPPYCGVTNYRLDNWIRLWLLGGPSLPDWESSQKYANSEKYAALLSSVFVAAKPLLSSDALIYIRTDSREFTRNTTLSIVRELWPHYRLFLHSETPDRTQTELFGDHSPKPGETDILATLNDSIVPEHFSEIFMD